MSNTPPNVANNVMEPILNSEAVVINFINWNIHVCGRFVHNLHKGGVLQRTDSLAAAVALIGLALLAAHLQSFSSMWF